MDGDNLQVEAVENEQVKIDTAYTETGVSVHYHGTIKMEIIVSQ